MKRRIVIFAFAFIALLGAGDVFAQMVWLLPESHYLDGAWQGTSYYEEQDGLNVRIDFAVYDTEDEDHPDDFEWTAEPPMPETDRYIYAYQIFNHPTADEEVAYFQVLDIDGGAINEALMHSTTSQDDLSDGVEPLESDTQGVWEFDWGVLIASEHSYFLIFSSNHAPVAGSYEITSFEPEGEFPVVPEPATVTLLGLGGAMAFSVGRRKRVV